MLKNNAPSGEHYPFALRDAKTIRDHSDLSPATKPARNLRKHGVHIATLREAIPCATSPRAKSVYLLKSNVSLISEGA